MARPITTGLRLPACSPLLVMHQDTQGDRIQGIQDPRGLLAHTPIRLPLMDIPRHQQAQHPTQCHLCLHKMRPHPRRLPRLQVRARQPHPLQVLTDLTNHPSSQHSRSHRIDPTAVKRPKRKTHNSNTPNTHPNSPTWAEAFPRVVRTVVLRPQEEVWGRLGPDPMGDTPEMVWHPLRGNNPQQVQCQRHRRLPGVRTVLPVYTKWTIIRTDVFFSTNC